MIYQNEYLLQQFNYYQFKINLSNFQRKFAVLILNFLESQCHNQKEYLFNALYPLHLATTNYQSLNSIENLS